jgi:hypothetical protein
VPEALERLALQCLRHDLTIAVQLHPRDYHAYASLPPDVFVQAIKPSDAMLAVAYCSTAVEAFLSADRTVLLFDYAGDLTEKYAAVIDIFRRFEARDGGRLEIAKSETKLLSRIEALRVRS